MNEHRPTRRDFLRSSAACALGLALPPGLLADPALDALIREAGSAESDAVRYRLLLRLAADPALGAELRAQLGPVLALAEEWANGREQALEGFDPLAQHDYLNDFFDRVEPEALEAGGPPESSPLHPLWALYRGRVVLWYAIESGRVRSSPELVDLYHGTGRRLLGAARRAFPENRVAGMYLGHDIPWPVEHEYPADPDAPRWANLQREGLEKLADVVHWWIAERQLPNGEYGGGWNDDVEMWRWWAPVLIGFRDPVLEAAQEKLSSAIFLQPHMRGGFTSRMSDVEHTAEDSADTITPMMHLAPRDPEWRRRARRLAELMRDRWTGRNERGQLQFRSVYFNVERVEEGNPNRAVDVVYNARTVQPALLLWQRTGDPELETLFTDWLDTWVDAAARAERGKPAGVLPSAIHWPDGRVGGVGAQWWDAEVYPDRAETYYNWPSQAGAMTSALLLAFHRTGRERYLEPIRSMARLWREHRGAAEAEGEPGGPAWAAARIARFLPPALAKYRLLTGDRQFDDLLMEGADGYLAYRFAGDVAGLEAALETSARALRANWPAYTDEVRYTDRVVAFGSNYLRDHDPEAPLLDPQLLYASATGDLDWAGYFPVNAVRWLTLPREIAALVVAADTSTFAADLYHFGADDRTLPAELYLLAPGQYRMTLAGPDGAVLASGVVTAPEGDPVRIEVVLPPRRLCRLTVSP